MDSPCRSTVVDVHGVRATAVARRARQVDDDRLACSGGGGVLLAEASCDLPVLGDALAGVGAKAFAKVRVVDVGPGVEGLQVLDEDVGHELEILGNVVGLRDAGREDRGQARDGDLERLDARRERDGDGLGAVVEEGMEGDDRYIDWQRRSG